MKHLKLFIQLCVSLLVTFLPVHVSNSCAGYDPEYYEQRFSFFQQSMAGLRQLSHFYYDAFNPLYGGSDGPDVNLNNTKEWAKALGEGIRYRDVKEMLYNSSLEELEALQNDIDAGNAIGGLWDGNRLASMMKAGRHQDVLNYFIYAKNCLPHVQAPYYSWDFNPDDRDTEAMAQLVALGKAGYAATSNNYLKLRYMYQIVRLLHYSFDYEATISTYDEYAGSLRGVKSNIKYWALAHKAGALWSLDQVAEANVLFARVFQNAPEKRLMARQSFQLTGKTVLDESLRLAESNAERATIWLLLALKTDGRGLEAMKEIYKLYPASDALPLLLVRDVAHLEQLIMPTYHHSTETDGLLEMKRERLYPYTEAYLNELQAFAGQVATEGQVELGGTWYVAAAYLAWLGGYDEQANKYLVTAQTQYASAQRGLKRQINAIRLATLVLNQATATPEFEYLMMQTLQKLEYDQKIGRKRRKLGVLDEHLRELIYRKLYNLYVKDNNAMMAELALANTNLVEYGKVPLSDQVEPEAVLEFVTSQSTTEWQKYLGSDLPYTIDDLNEVIGSKLLSRGNFKEASAYFEQINTGNLSWRSEVYNMPANPFKNRIIECHDCDHYDFAGQTLNKLELVRQLIALEQQAKEGSEQAARAYIKIGNAMYNLSNIGNCAQAYRNMESMVARLNQPYYWDYEYSYTYDKAAGSIPDVLVPETENAAAYLENQGGHNPEHWYSVAIAVATNPETKAEAAFMAAKWEQHLYYDRNNEPDQDAKLEYRTFFRHMVENYSQTDYYQQVIDECTYFRDFVQ